VSSRNPIESAANAIVSASQGLHDVFRHLGRSHEGEYETCGEASCGMDRSLVRDLRAATVKEGRSWYRALDAAGKVWCESGSPDEVTASLDRSSGASFERLRTYTVSTVWEPWYPGRDGDG
jgi:hypothetical protein